MQEFNNFLLELTHVPLLWLIFSLFLIGQIYLFYVRRFGRRLIRKLYPHAEKPFSVKFINSRSFEKISIYYQEPADNPEELQIVLRTKLSGNYHFIDPLVARKFGGYLLSAQDQGHHPVSSLFKLVTNNGKINIPNWNTLFDILREIKTLGFQHIHVHRKKLIIGNTNVNHEVIDDEKKLIELKKNIDRCVESGRKLQQFLEDKASFTKRSSGATIIILTAIFMIVGLLGFYFVWDLYPLVDDSQLIIPYFVATGVLSLLFLLVLSIEKNPHPIVLRLLSSLFFAACAAFGCLQPAVAYNGQCGQTEAISVKGTVINLKIIGQSSGKTAILAWLLGNKYGTRLKASSGVHRVEVKLASKVTHHYSISKALWLTLSQNDKVDVSIALGCLGWKWVAGFHLST